MKYQRFEAEDVADMLRHELEARKAKVMAEQAALSNELVGPHKMTWDFWQVLFERRDIKALADFEATGEFRRAVQQCIQALETSPLWVNRPERNTLLERYRKMVAPAIVETEPDCRVHQEDERLDTQDRRGVDAGHYLDHDATIAALFDPVSKEQLEAMFPDSDKWASYAERQSRNGLKDAAFVSRAKFNPYRAAKWWVDTQSPGGWTWERCLRKLANNLPPRSRDSKHLLTGDFN